jgi:hypothetical protein
MEPTKKPPEGGLFLGVASSLEGCSVGGALLGCAALTASGKGHRQQASEHQRIG